MRRFNRLRFIVLVAFALWFGLWPTVALASGAVYYCRTDGSDSNAGTADTAGGAFLTIGKAGSVMVGGDILYIKGPGTYTCTSATVNIATGTLSLTAGATATPTMVLGYTSTAGDNPTGTNRPTITASGIATFKLITIPNSGSAYIANLILDGGSLTSSRGIDGSAGSSVNSLVQNCKLLNFTNAALIGAATMLADNIEVTGCTTSTAVQNTNLHASTIHDNTSVAGFSASVTVTVTDSILANNSGASSDGAITTGTTVSTWVNNLFYGNGRDGLKITASAAPVLVQNCYSEANATNQYSATATMGGIRLINCGAKGTTLYNSSIAASQVISFVTCTTTAFVNAGAGNFMLNNSATGGRLLRRAGIPRVFPGLASTSSYLDVGPANHKDIVLGRRGR